MRIQFFSSTCSYLVLPATLAEDVVFSPLCIVGLFVKAQVAKESGFVCGSSILFY